MMMPERSFPTLDMGKIRAERLLFMLTGRTERTESRINAPEVLAPAGDFERLEAAVRFGADAVYLGGKAFGMRAASANFGPEELKRAVDYCHAHRVRLYLTCNTLPRNNEIDQLPAFLRSAGEAGVDALIVADIGILMEARRLVPEIDVHISTQAGVVNYLTANELHKLGAKRVVLARELSLEEIRGIRQNTPPELEIECFVHGAMCVSFSGRCLISQYMIHRDANRGECAQPCRWKYHLMEEKRPGQFFPVEERDGGTYLYNARDLCMIEHIPELVQAGITSFKIEGRAKSFYYTACTANAYRAAVDEYMKDPDSYRLPAWLREEVTKVSHRQYCTGFYFGPPEEGQCYEDGGYIRTYDVAAVVKGYDPETGRLSVIQRNRFFEGDRLEVLAPGREPWEITVSALENGEGERIASANHPMEEVSFQGVEISAGAILRKETGLPGDDLKK